MSSMLSTIELKDAFTQSGCPICTISQEEAFRYINHLLWENVNDLETRLRIFASLGYCPRHTELLAFTELTRFGSAMKISIIYESLIQVVVNRLLTWHPIKMKPKWSLLFHDWVYRLGFSRRSKPRLTVITVGSPCRVCQIADDSAKFALSTLLEELNARFDIWSQHFMVSDGLCLAHLRFCLQEYGDQYPDTVQYLVRDTIQRLNNRRSRMNEYIRKLTWEARHERITEQEYHSWQETLAFFTGYPSSHFNIDGKEEK